jgi:hypothetical protein
LGREETAAGSSARALAKAAAMMAGRNTAEGRQRQAARNAEQTRTPAAADTVSA